MACLSTKSVNPRMLNPYRSVRQKFKASDVERDHRILAKGGKLIEQTITAKQVVHDV